MGTVPIWKQWLIIAASAFLSPVIVLAVACAFGWVIFRRLRPQRVVAVGSAHAPARGGPDEEADAILLDRGADRR